MSDVFNDIARALNKKNKKEIDKATYGTGFTLGTITESGLKLDDFKYEIPNSDYKVLEYLTVDSTIETETSGEHSHNIKLPDELKPLEIGDRVLVAKLGYDCIVLGRVVSNLESTTN